jgi:hypothetical protein
MQPWNTLVIFVISEFSRMRIEIGVSVDPTIPSHQASSEPQVVSAKENTEFVPGLSIRLLCAGDP